MSAALAEPHDAAPIPDEVRRLVPAISSCEAEVETFRRMLWAANTRANLVGASTLGNFWRRHFLDSAQLLHFEPEARVWADLGSGAGLPGIVLAILMKGRPGARVHLVESRAKRRRFLSDVVEVLELPAEVHHARAEDLRLQVEIVTARACAPLERLLGFAKPYMDLGARGLFLKGQDVALEIAQARGTWRFEVQTHASLSDPRGRVVMIPQVTLAARR